MAERKRRVGRPRKSSSNRRVVRRSGHGKRGRKKGFKMSEAHKKAISAGLKRYWASKGKGRRRKMSRDHAKLSPMKRKKSRKVSRRGRPKGSKNKFRTRSPEGKSYFK